MMRKIRNKEELGSIFSNKMQFTPKSVKFEKCWPPFNNIKRINSILFSVNWIHYLLIGTGSAILTMILFFTFMAFLSDIYFSDHFHSTMALQKAGGTLFASPYSTVPFGVSSSSADRFNYTSGNIDESDNLLTRIYKDTIRSVVMVDTTITYPNGSSFANQGSGFIYDKDGHVLTNYHVIEGANNTAVFIKFIDGNSYPVTVVGRDRFSDLAVLEINDPSVLKMERALPLPLSNSSLNVGERVVAIGNPLGFSGTMTEGIISQLNRTVVMSDFFQLGMIQFDAPITHGNSGGPLLNMKKEVVGLTSSGLVEVGFISFGIPSDTVKRIVPSLIADGRYAHPWLGISGIDVIPGVTEDLGLDEAKGVIITEVAPGSPAAVAGLSAGTNPIGQIGYDVIYSDADVILALDKKNVRGIDDILNYIDTKAVGDTVTIRGERNGHMGTVIATLTERPQ